MLSKKDEDTNYCPVGNDEVAVAVENGWSIKGGKKPLEAVCIVYKNLKILDARRYLTKCC